MDKKSWIIFLVGAGLSGLLTGIMHELGVSIFGPFVFVAALIIVSTITIAGFVRRTTPTSDTEEYRVLSEITIEDHEEQECFEESGGPLDDDLIFETPEYCNRCSHERGICRCPDADFVAAL